MAVQRNTAPSRGASRQPEPTNKPVHPLIWMIGGLIVGAFAMSLLKLEPGNDAIQRDKNSAESDQPTPKAQQESAANKPKFEFYSLLSESKPNMVVPPAALPTPPNQAEIDAAKRAEAARAQAILDDKKPPVQLPTPAPTPVKVIVASAPVVAPAPVRVVAPPPPPVRVTPPPPPPVKVVAPTPPPVRVAPPPPPPPPRVVVAPPPVPVPAAVVKKEEKIQFFLQAGSFPERAKAESTRAQLLLSGQDARIESGQVSGKTWHRVVVGPFASRDQVTSAQRQLSNNGFNNMLLQQRISR